jgi:FKBP-type peptidyl-prolyl cis-trans isomerase
LYTIIFLIVLVLAGAIYIFASKNKNPNQVFPSPSPSATITPTEAPTASASATNKNMNELKIEDEKVGTGIEAVKGKSVTVNYLGTLTDGTKFDSSYDRGQPFTFNLGAGEVIQGWDQGVAGMKVGGKRKLTIPSLLAYGQAGVPGAIPGGATLIFEVELLKVE